jgi:hypothetical protein
VRGHARARDCLLVACSCWCLAKLLPFWRWQVLHSRCVHVISRCHDAWPLVSESVLNPVHPLPALHAARVWAEGCTAQVLIQQQDVKVPCCSCW